MSRLMITRGFLAVCFAFVVGCQGQADSGAATSAPAPAPSALGSVEQATGAHILIAYKGALRAPENVTRTREDAQKLASELVARARAGESFEELARKYSDDASSARGGEAGTFDKKDVRKPFDVLFTLSPGQVGDVAETDYGFHLIERVR